MKARRWIWMAPAIGALVACGGGGGDGGGGAGGGGGPVAALPPTAAPIAYDTSEVGLDETRETLLSESAPTLSAPEDVEYPYDPAEPDADPAQPTVVRMRSQCTTRTYDLKSNPAKVAMYSADGNVSYPGALLRGDDFRRGNLRRLGVRPEDRAPLTFVINNVYSQNGSTSGTVPQPDLQPVSDAVKARIVQAFNDNIPIGDSVAYNYAETNDVRRFMLKARLSARYGGVSGALGTRIDKTRSQRSVVVNLVQKLFDVEVQQPPTKNDWFGPSFFAGGLQPLLDDGSISATDSPVYVSRVTYGRVLTFSLTSTASESDIETLLRASVKTLVAGGSLALDSKTSQVNDSKTVNVASIGGSGAAAIAAAQSGDWGSFFKQQLRLTEAVPIQVEYRNLYDNSPAGVTETTRATEEVCTPQIVVPGPFDFALRDLHERPAAIGAIQQVVSGDFNGDAIADLVWNELTGTTNRFYVGYGTTGGHLHVTALACGGKTCDLSDPATPWGQYQLRSGDFNGDGRADLLWIRAGSSLDTIELRALAADPAGEPGGFAGFAGALVSASLPVTAEERAGTRPEVIVEDLSNDGRADLVLWTLNRPDGRGNQLDYRVVRAVAPAAGSGAPFGFEFQTRASMGYATDFFNSNPATANYSLDAFDIDSDGWNDLVWNLRGQDFSAPATAELNSVVWRLNTRSAGDVAFDSVSHLFRPGATHIWQEFVPLYGDFDGDARTDLAWASASGANPSVYQAAYDGASGAYVERARQSWSGDGNGPVVLAPSQIVNGRRQLAVGNFNGDAALDVVAAMYVTKSGQANFVNRVQVLKGVRGGSPMFDTSTLAQEHPVNQDWQGYAWVFVGDFNGDGLDDVVWNNAALDNSSYFGFAKREADQ